jgi:hypothetical protein
MLLVILHLYGCSGDAPSSKPKKVVTIDCLSTQEVAKYWPTVTSQQGRAKLAENKNVDMWVLETTTGQKCLVGTMKDASHDSKATIEVSPLTQ